MQKIRWGIIGCGDVTEVKSGPGFQLAENSELVAVMRRNGALAEDYAKRHKVPHWFDDAQKLINHPDVDAVYIATPPSSHKEYTLAVAQVGKPVYVEKPMAMNFSEAQEMVNFCKDANVPFFVAHYRRGLERFNKIKSILDEGQIGKVRFVNTSYYAQIAQRDIDNEPGNWRVQPETSSCGYFCDLAPHMLDIQQYMLGNIVEAHGQAVNQEKIYPAEDMVSGSYVFENGVHGTGIWNFNSGRRLDRTEIVGSKGSITFATFGNDPIILQRGDTIEEIEAPNPVHIQQGLIQTIVNQLLGKGKCPSTGEDALPTSWVMDKLLGRL